MRNAHDYAYREKHLTEKTHHRRQQTKQIWLNCLSSGLLLLAVTGCLRAQTTNPPPNNYLVHNLVSDLAGNADVQDSNLVNPWGVGFGPTPFWAGNNGSGTATLYTGTGAIVPLVVSIPQAGNAGKAGKVTG